MQIVRTFFDRHANAVLRFGAMIAVVAGAVMLMSGRPHPARAADDARVLRAIAVPGFWDPRRRPERPDISRMERHPLHDRGRLSAVQLRRPRRQSGRLQCRSRADDLRGAQGQLHHADAPLRHLLDALNDNRGDAAIASIAVTPDGRAAAPISPTPITVRPRASSPADSGILDVTAGEARGQEDRGGRGLGA